MHTPQFPSAEFQPLKLEAGDRRYLVVAPLCVDCQHHVLVERPEPFDSKHACVRPEMRSPVTGAHANCDDARQALRANGTPGCGPAGTLFAQRVGDRVEAGDQPLAG